MSRGMKFALWALLVIAVPLVVIPLIGTMHHAAMAVENSSSAQIKPPVSTPEQKKKGENCGKLLSKLGREMWVDMHQNGDLVEVVTSPGFELASYDDRNRFTSVVVCYYTDGRMDEGVKAVEFMDPHTHAVFGHWYKGVELKFDR